MNIIKECLIDLKSKKIEESISKNIDQALICDEEQLEYAIGSFSGLQLNRFSIQYAEGVGFRVRNIDENIKGRDFQCNRIEKSLNDKYKSLLVSEKSTDGYTLIYASIIQFKHMFTFDLMSDEFKLIWAEKLEILNKRWNNEMCVKFDNRMQPGCLIYGTDLEKAKRIAENVYQELKFDIYEIVLVYGVGEVSLINKQTVHTCRGPVFIKVGRTLDMLLRESHKEGIFYVKDEGEYDKI